MRLDQAQEDLFCAIANDEYRTPHSMPGWYYSDQRLFEPVSYTHLRAHETGRNLVCRLLLEKKNKATY